MCEATCMARGRGREGKKKIKTHRHTIRYSRKLRSQWHEGFKEQLTAGPFISEKKRQPVL